MHLATIYIYSINKEIALLLSLENLQQIKSQLHARQAFYRLINVIQISLNYQQNKMNGYSGNSRTLPLANSRQSDSVDLLKRNLLHDAQSYNVQQFRDKKLYKKQQKELQTHIFSQYNKKVAEQAQQQKLQNLHRKQHERQLLQNQYEEQIHNRSMMQKKNKDQQKLYAQQFSDYQEHYHQRRMNDILRMYRPIAHQAVNPRIKTEEVTKLYAQIHNPIEPISHSKQTQILDSTTDRQSYHDYLKRQIERKNNQKKNLQHRKLELEKQEMRNNEMKYRDSLDQLKQQHKKQQIQFKRGLDQQLQSRNQYRNKFSLA